MKRSCLIDELKKIELKKFWYLWRRVDEKGNFLFRQVIAFLGRRGGLQRSCG